MPEWHVNRGKPPRNKTVELQIEWANGMLDKHTYTAGQLIWELRGWDFYIGRFAKVER